MTISTKPVVLSWSGGKDSALALKTLRDDSAWCVAGLLTTIDETTERVPMHGIDRGLLVEQAHRLDLEIDVVEMPPMPSNEVYERRMAGNFDELKGRGIETIAFGDLFLEDVREFRERQVEDAGMNSLFPIWERDTSEMARQFIDDGFRALITCVDTDQLDARFAGRDYDDRLLADLPDGIDPCAENGEFHTFVWDGPGFSAPIEVDVEDGPLEQERFKLVRLVRRNHRR